MSVIGFKNPTPLEVGREGILFGNPARVIGRSVLQSADGYRWDEYHVRLSSGTATTLVYESGIWKRFDMFDPKNPLSAQDASEIFVGNDVMIDGTTLEVTYVGDSVVRHIEGEAPEGYRAGSRARYFNAQSGSLLYVVSWTGNEVEFYTGRNLPRGAVESAFNLPAPSIFSHLLASGSGGLDGWFDHSGNLLGSLAGVAAIIFFAFIGTGGFGERTSNPPAPVPAPELRLSLHAQGSLGGHLYAIAGHALYQIAETSGRFSRDEYDLVDSLGQPALLVRGLDMDSTDWCLLQPAPTSTGLRPVTASVLKPRASLSVDATTAVVHALFRCTTLGRDGDAPRAGNAGSLHYGFTARTREGWVLVRWDASNLEVHAGAVVSEADVEHAFGKGSPR